jgi:outer membrane protein assembly factor BamB
MIANRGQIASDRLGRRRAAAGWFLLLVIGFAGIPLAWQAAVTRWLAYGVSARLHWPALVAVLVTAFAALSRSLARRGKGPIRPVAIILLIATWCLMHALCWKWRTSSFGDDPSLVLIYVATTAWIGWCAAVWFTRASVAQRANLLAICLVPLFVWTSCVRCYGLDGQGRPIPGWRFSGTGLGFVGDLGRDERGGSDPTTRPAEDYPAFRGRDGLAVIPGVRLARDWQSKPPRLLWRRAIGGGWGGFAVAGRSAFTQEQRATQECVVCYDLGSGRERWQHADETRFSSPTAGDGPRATPAVSDGRVYSLGATGLLNCLDAETGRKQWSVDVLADNGASNLYHGLSGSPLVLGELVVVSVGQRDHSLVAYHRDTGRRVWHAGSDPAGYGSPLACTLDGVEQIAILNRPGLSAHDPATGRQLWTFPWANDQETNCSQPAPVGEDRLLVSTGYGKGCALVQVRHVGGAWSAEALWTSRQLKTKFASPVVRGRFAYGLDDGVLACLDLANGSRRWKRGRYGHGQVLLVGELLLVQCEDGDVALVAADPAAHRELARVPGLAGKTWNYPALAGSLLVVRNDQEAACFDLPLETER